jgi:mono/diheme cytochrome c family protein
LSKRIDSFGLIHRNFDFKERERTDMSRASTGLIAGTLFALLCLVPLSAQNPGGSAEAKKLKNPVRVSPQSIATGKDLYTKNCRGCHGPEAKGEGPMAPKESHPSNLTDQEWTRGSTDGEIFAVVRDGAGPKFIMKGYKARMTEEEMWSIVNYLRSLGAKGSTQ